jgi:PPK2 family polyphosphate:nucleotide phosphotransferase
MNSTKQFIVKPGQDIRLSRFDPDFTDGFKDKSDVEEHLQRNVARLARLQDLLWAEKKRALLIILQAVDAGGKDGTIKHVMSGVNPQGCVVTSFKVPSVEESGHDFLWRVHKAVPVRGQIGIFNRSHYEDVLVVRVHKLVEKAVWKPRFQQINNFERMLTENGVTILKFFLHISREEQKERLESRLVQPSKRWKISEADAAERKYWNAYMRAYEDVLSRCSTPWAPWFVIPSNKKWFRNLAVSSVIVEALDEMDMKYPEPAADLSKIAID